MPLFEKIRLGLLPLSMFFFILLFRIFTASAPRPIQSYSSMSICLYVCLLWELGVRETSGQRKYSKYWPAMTHTKSALIFPPILYHDLAWWSKTNTFFCKCYSISYQLLCLYVTFEICSFFHLFYHISFLKAYIILFNNIYSTKIFRDKISNIR